MLIETTKEMVSGLKEQLECEQDLNMQEESETFEIFLYLHHKRIKALDELYLKK